MDNERVANWVIAHHTQQENIRKEDRASRNAINFAQSDAYVSNVNRQTDLEVLNEPGPSNVSETRYSHSPLLETNALPCTNDSCKNLRSNLQNLSFQISLYHKDNVRFENSQTELKQMTSQMAELGTYVENLTTQLYESRNQLRKVEVERDAAKQKELEMKKHLEIMESHSATLRKKSLERDDFEKRYLSSVKILEDIQSKRLQLSQNLQQVVSVCKKSKTETENVKIQLEKIKADKAAAMTKISFYKKQVPSMLKLIDDLTGYTSNLPTHIRKKIDSFAEQELRAQLLGGQVTQKEDENEEMASDDEWVNNIESLIKSGVKAPSPIKKVPVKSRSRTKSMTEDEADDQIRDLGLELSPVKEIKSPKIAAKQPATKQFVPSIRSSGRIAAKGGRKSQHNIDDAEKAYNVMLSHKLNKNEAEPIAVTAETVGAKSSIHGKKGITVREQQAKMISVSEKVAQMKKEKEKSPVKKVMPPPLFIDKPSISTTSLASKNIEDETMAHRRRFSTPDLHSDLRLTPSPVKLTPTESLESLIEKDMRKSPEKKTIPPASSMPSLTVEEPIPEESSLPTTSSFASMPHLNALDEPMEDIPVESKKVTADCKVLVMSKDTKHKSPRKVTFELSDDEDEIKRPTQKKTRTLSESSIESNPLEILSNEEPSKTELPRPSDPSKEKNVQEKEIAVLPSTSTSPVKIATPTKKALKTMSSVSEEIKSPIKTIPEWITTASHYSKSKSPVRQDTKEAEKPKRVAGKKAVDSKQPIKAEDSFFIDDILQNAHMPAKNATETAKEAVKSVPVEMESNNTKESEPKKYTVSSKKVEIKSTISPKKAVLNPSAQMEQAKLAMSKKLRAGNNPLAKPAQKQTKITKISAEKKPKTEKLPKKVEQKKEKELEESQPVVEETVQEPEKKPKRVNKVAKEIPKTAPKIIEAIVKPTRQTAKRKAADETASVPAKKSAPVPKSEAILRRAFSLECTDDELRRKIPIEELEEIKEIEEKRYIAIMIEQVFHQKSVDMWQSVLISYKNDSTDIVHNKIEENFLSVAHQLCSETINIFLPFAKLLAMKLMFLKVECLCYKIVRLIAMSLQQLEVSSGKSILKGLINFFMTIRPDLFGKSLVYILNRLPQDYLSLFIDEEYQDCWKVLVLYSGPEITDIIEFYWTKKVAKGNLLPKQSDLDSWLSQYSICRSMLENIEVEGTNIKLDSRLKKIFSLRPVCFGTTKNFVNYILPEIRVLNEMLSDLNTSYGVHDKADNIIGSIFGNSSSIRVLADPDKTMVLEISLRIQGLTSLFSELTESRMVAIKQDKKDSFVSSINEGAELARELMEFLERRQENAPEQRIILLRTLEIFTTNYSDFRRKLS